MEQLLENLDKDNLYVSPVASPMASDKLEAKILAVTGKLMAHKKVKRGVKEVGKAIRKGCRGVCIFASDVSPVDVFSHLPIQCETNNIPYIFIRSRLELGQAAQTKRPTSVVLLQMPEEDYPKLREKFEKIDTKVRELNDYF